jgi:DNA-binding Lrp family transcriptional regulator
MKTNQPAVEQTESSIVVKGDSPVTREPVSRRDVLAELQMLGVNTESFGSMSIEALNDLLTGIKAIVQNKPAAAAKRGRPRSTGEFVPVFSRSDKKILQQLVASSGRVSTLSLSRQLDIPMSTIQRRRVRLEKNVVDMNYSLRLKSLGWRTGTLMVSASDGKADLLGSQILEIEDNVVSVTRIVGENSMDLMVEVVFKKTEELLALIDHIKSLGGEKKMFWGESVKQIGRNTKCYQKVVEAL